MCACAPSASDLTAFVAAITPAERLALCAIDPMFSTHVFTRMASQIMATIAGPFTITATFMIASFWFVRDGWLCMAVVVQVCA